MKRRHRWIGHTPDHVAEREADASISALIDAERTGVVTPDYTWIDTLPEVEDFSLPGADGDVLAIPVGGSK